MKKLIIIKVIILVIALFFAKLLSAQTGDKVIKDTTIKSVVYKLYEGNRGGHYILKTSKTGTTYKKYIKK